MATNLPSCFFIKLLEQLLKFLVNFTFLKYVKSQRSYGFLITKELIFGFQILDLKDRFSASLSRKHSRLKTSYKGLSSEVISYYNILKQFNPDKAPIEAVLIKQYHT